MKSILITGGTGKIGKQLANHFLRNNHQVIITSRSFVRVKEMINSEQFVNTNLLHVLEVDLTEDNAISTVLFFLQKHNLNPSVLINNARSLDYLKVKENGESEAKNILNEYNLNVVLPYELSNALATMRNNDLKSIINISSIYGIVPFNPNLYGDNYYRSAPIQYSLSKAALIHLTKELAIRFRKKIRVNTVSYGGVEGRVDDEFKKKYAMLCPEGDMLTEEQTTGPVAFLASDMSKGITGQNIIQDGGWTIW